MDWYGAWRGRIGTDLETDNRGGAAITVDKPVAVELDAELRQIKSMVDHTYNVTINIPEYHLEQVQLMMGWLGGVVHIVMMQEEN